MEEKEKCDARSKRFFPTHKQRSSIDLTGKSRNILGHREAMFRPAESCFGKRRRQTRSCTRHKTAGNTTRKLKRDVLGRRRPLCSANVVCANQNIKKSGCWWLKQNPFVQRRKKNLLESHCRTKIPRRNKIGRTTRKAGRCDKISCNRYRRRALSGVSL